MTQSLKQLENQYPVILNQDIIWGDMDAFGHINNTVYFRYFENARIEYFNRIGVLEQKKQLGVGPIAAEGDGLIVYFDYAGGGSCEIPAAIVEAIKTLKGL